MIKDIEFKLSFWRDGQTSAERLAAALLKLYGYDELNPQSPLGGPDGKKDILCVKGGLTWVAAVYFPTGPTTFAKIKKKFIADLNGMPEHPKGFVFVTNQNITPTQRVALSTLATAKRKECDVLHVQIMQTLLDSAPGYGVRIQYLRIGMTLEEQLSWAVDSDSQTAKAIAAQTRELLELRSSIEQMGIGQKHIIQTMGVAQSLAKAAPTPDLMSVSSFTKDDRFPPLSAKLTVEQILFVHRLTCFDLPSRLVGNLRTNSVWLGNSEGNVVDHIQPPPPEEVPSLLKQLCDDWGKSFSENRTEDSRLAAMAKFHVRFLFIHPFMDGNGRVARAILMQQCLDYFGRAQMSLMNRGALYYAALKTADGGDFDHLKKLISPIVKK